MKLMKLARMTKTLLPLVATVLGCTTPSPTLEPSRAGGSAEVRAIVQRGLALAKTRLQQDLAIAECTRAIEMEPTNADAYHCRGRALRWKKQYEAAVVELTRALELDPRHAGAYADRGAGLLDIKHNIKKHLS